VRHSPRIRTSPAISKSDKCTHASRPITGIVFRRRSSVCAVHWYFRFQLSLRDIEKLLFERGVVVSYETFGAGANGMNGPPSGEDMQNVDPQQTHDALRRLVANLWCDGATAIRKSAVKTVPRTPASSVSARLLRSSSGPTPFSGVESRVYAAAVTRRCRATGWPSGSDGLLLLAFNAQAA
jgi:hypothetical protein